MGTNDIFQSINALPVEAIRKIIDRLEFRGKDPIFVNMRDRYLEKMNLASCKRVLDLGCGTGVVARALAKCKGFKGEIVGIDFSEALIDAANRLASEEGVSDRIDFRVGDSHALSDADNSFDAVLAHTLVSHVSSPASVIADIARVTVPGGISAIFDGDYASLTFGAGDPDTNASMVDGILNAIVANPYIMRQLPHLITTNGLSIVDFIPEIYAEAGQSSFFASMLDSYVPMAVRAETVPDKAGTDWHTDQINASDDGTFFGACNYYTYLVRKPL